MGAIAQKRLEEPKQEGTDLPKITLTFNQVKEELKDFGERKIPDILITELVKTGDMEKAYAVKRALLGITAIDKDRGLEFFENGFDEGKARHLIDNPGDFLELARAAGRGAAGALWMLQNEGVFDTYVAHKAEILLIAKAAESETDMALYSLGMNDVVKSLFLANPGSIVELANGTGGFASRALRALEDKDVARLFEQDRRHWMELAKAAGSAYSLFQALKTDALADKFAEDPEFIVKNFKKFIDVTGKNAVYAFYALKNQDIANRFVKDPDFVNDCFGRMNGAATNDGRGVYDAIQDEEVGRLFLEHNLELAGLVRAIGDFAGSALSALGNKSLADKFIQDPRFITDWFAKISQATRTGEAISLLAKEGIAERFLQDPEGLIGNFKKLVDATGDGAWGAIDALLREQVFRDVFLSDPERMIGGFGRLADQCKDKKWAFNPFMWGNEAAELFLGHMEECIAIAKASGSTDSLNYLTGGTAVLFRKHAKEFAEIASFSREKSAEVFEAIGKGTFAKLFEAKPKAFVGLAKVTGADMPAALYALQNNMLRGKFESSSSSVIIVFDDVKRATGGNAKAAFTLLINDQYAKWLWENPRKAVGSLEELVSAAKKDARDGKEALERGNSALSGLLDPSLGRLFIAHPEQYCRILEEGGFYRNPVLEGLRVLVGSSGNLLADMFVEKPDEATWCFLNILSSTGDRAEEAFEALGKEKAAKAFVRNPLDFVRLAGATRISSAEAFLALENEKLADLFHENPRLVICALNGICGARTVEKYGTMLMALGKDQAALDRLADDLRPLSKLAKKKSGQSLLRFHYSQYGFSEKGEAVMPSWNGVDKEEVMEVLEVLNKKFGIEFFERYSPRLIGHLYSMALYPNYQKGKPTALMILNKMTIITHSRRTRRRTRACFGATELFASNATTIRKRWRD